MAEDAAAQQGSAALEGPSDSGGPEVPQPRHVIAPVVSEHRERFVAVLDSAWSTLAHLRAASPRQMSGAGASTRGMLVSDFTREPAHRIFAGVPGVSVDDRYGRPWVCLDGGRVQIRFRKLTPALQICASDSERATRLAFHLGDPVLPEMPEATVLTAGYVLDTAELAIERMALVCHIGSQVHYVLDLPCGSAAVTAPTQLPLMPLSPPVIRSARAAAAQRLARRADVADA